MQINPAYELRRCPICFSDDHNTVFTQKILLAQLSDSFEQCVRICKNCGMIYVSPYLDSPTLFRFYSEFSLYEYSFDNYSYPTPLKKHAQQQFDYINSLELDFKSVLDIGCSHGYLLSLFKNQGKFVHGIEPSSKLKSLAKEIYDIDITTDFIDQNFSHDHKYDLIIISHVLEHITNPIQFLSYVSNLLAEGGHLFIETPCLDLFSNVDPFSFSFEHINYFSYSSFLNLRSLSGFSLMEQYIFDNDKNISPFYPTFAQIWRQSDKSSIIKNNFTKNNELVGSYIGELEVIFSSINNRLSSKLESSSNYCLWGCGVVASYIIQLCSIANDDRFLCIFDSDTRKNGLTLFGRPVYFNDAFNTVLKKYSIDAIVITSWSSQKEIYDYLLNICPSNINIITLFD